MKPGRWPTLEAQQAALQHSICGLAPAHALLRAPAEPGLGVYRQAYRARLRAALRDNYTVLQRALGDEDFDALAEAYLQARPSRQPSIRWFGDGLADFMADPHAAQLPHPALIDFARMDWALRSAFDAADAAPLQGEALQRLAAADWPALRLRPQPSLQIVALDWAIEPAWRVLRACDPEHGQDAPELPAPQAHAHDLLVWRDAGLETRWRSLDALEARLLRALQAGSPFAELCAMAARDLGEDRAAAATVQALQRWLAEGLLAA